jgi:hypothetical protein
LNNILSVDFFLHDNIFIKNESNSLNNSFNDSRDGNTENTTSFIAEEYEKKNLNTCGNYSLND